MPIRKYQTNFTAGEITPDLESRTDLPLYQNGAAVIRNMRPLPGGGLRRRGGLRHAAMLQNIAYQHNEWIFNASQTYQVLFSSGRVDIHDGVSGDPLAAITIAVTPGVGSGAIPWTSQIGQLSVYTQGDFLFIAHPDFAPHLIRRLGGTSFQVEPFVFDSAVTGAEHPIFQPFHRFVPNNELIRLIAVSGYTTAGWAPGAEADISTYMDFFTTAAYIGTRLLISGAQWEITGITNSRLARGVLRSANFRIKIVENGFTILQGTDGVIVYDPAHNYTPGADIVVSNATPFATLLYQNINGIREVTYVDAANWLYGSGAASATATEIGGGPNAVYWSNDVRTADWKEQMYSSIRGWPHCVGGYQTRLIFGGGRSTPNRLNFSHLEAPFNFDVGDGEDNDSIQVGISGRRTPTVLGVVGARHLQVFTSEGEYYVPGVEDKAGLTPATISVLPQSFYGIQHGLPAVEFDQSTLFISRNGNHVRQLVYGEQGYTAPDLSFVAHHIVTTPVWLAVQMEDPEQGMATALVVRANGSLAALTMMRSEKIAAWALHTTDGLIKTACAVDANAFFVVQRENAGTTTTRLEKLDRGYILDGSVKGSYVGRSGVDYEWSGFDLYANSSRRFVVDGKSEIGFYPVDGAGHVVIPVRASTLEIGYTFEVLIRTLPPELVLPDGPTPGEPRRVVSAAVHVRDTLGMTVRSNKVLNTQAKADLGLPATLINGRVQVHLMGWDERGQIDIRQNSAAPMTVMSVNLELEF